MTDRRPLPVVKWKHDEPGSELYLVAIMDDRTVVSACGRYAQGSGSRAVSWTDFLCGEMNELVGETMGPEVLEDVLRRLRALTA